MIKYRKQKQSDEEFLFALYASTRANEMNAVNWSDTQKQHFLKFQFNAQLHQYLNNYENATFEIIQQNGKAIGRLYLNSTSTEIKIIDISLLPEYRGKGIGTQILKGIIKKASLQQKTVSLNVFAYNPAKKLYQRLGFIQKKMEQPYIYMEKAPEEKIGNRD